MSGFAAAKTAGDAEGLRRAMHKAVTMAIIAAAFVPPRAAADEAASLMAYGRHLAQECAGCHGADASSGKESGIPRLAGRPAAEITDALAAFRSGERTNPVMVSVAKSLDERQIAALAAYFASLGTPNE